MTELGCELDLAIESLDTYFCRELRWKHLEDDLSSEPGVRREKDPGHSAPANLILHAERIAEHSLETLAKIGGSFESLSSDVGHGPILTPSHKFSRI